MPDPETMPDVVERLSLATVIFHMDRRNKALLIEAAAEITRLRARAETLEGALVEEREDVLWQAYGVGSERDGKWSHNFMADGEWLVRECGMDPALGWYDAATVQAAIPAAARAALKEKNDGA